MFVVHSQLLQAPLEGVVTVTFEDKWEIPYVFSFLHSNLFSCTLLYVYQEVVLDLIF